MSATRFSVVIPTRERAGTLRYALSTCLDQTFDDYEIVVSDNFSSPATREVVEAAASPRVRYFRTPEPLAMSANWEFGIGHARGEYVLVLGDDDGLLPHALAELDALARGHGARAVRWAMGLYTWPTIALPGQGDYLQVPLGCGTRDRVGAHAIRDVAAFREPYTELPMMYNAAVRRDVLDELRRRTGRVFPHPIPDVYTGFAVAHVAERYVSTERPMSVSGLSHASNGVATLFNRTRAGNIDREFFELNAKGGLRHEPTVPDLPVFPAVPVADTFAFAKRVLFPHLDARIDRQELVAECLSGARVSEADWPLALAEIRRSLGDAPALLAWFDAGPAATPYRAPPPPALRPPHVGLRADRLHLDAATFGVGDIAGAVRLAARVLALADGGRGPADLLAAAHGWEPRDRATLALHLSLHERDTAAECEIARLHAACAAGHAEVIRADARARALTEQVRELDRRLRAERNWSLKAPLRAAKKLLAKLTRRGAGTPTASA